MLPLFQDKFILGEATSSHFFRVTSSTQHLLFRDSYFFRTAAFFSFFRTATFSQELFFQNSFFVGVKHLQGRHFLRIRSSLRQLLFGAATLLGGTVQDKDIYKRANFPRQVLLHSINLFRKATFWKNLIFQKAIVRSIYLLFPENCLFRAAISSKDATIYSSYFFRTVTTKLLFLLIRQELSKLSTS